MDSSSVEVVAASRSYKGRIGGGKSGPISKNRFFEETHLTLCVRSREVLTVQGTNSTEFGASLR